MQAVTTTDNNPPTNAVFSPLKIGFGSLENLNNVIKHTMSISMLANKAMKLICRFVIQVVNAGLDKNV